MNIQSLSTSLRRGVSQLPIKISSNLKLSLKPDVISFKAPSSPGRQSSVPPSSTAVQATSAQKLFEAARKKNQSPAAFQVFIAQNELNIDARDDRGCTALWMAAECGNARAVRALIQAGASVGLENKDLETPLDVACYYAYKHPDALQIITDLLEARADIHREGFGNGNLPFQSVLMPLNSIEQEPKSDIPAILQLMIENGADVNKHHEDETLRESVNSISTKYTELKQAILSTLKSAGATDFQDVEG